MEPPSAGAAGSPVGGQTAFNLFDKVRASETADVAPGTRRSLSAGNI